MCILHYQEYCFFTFYSFSESLYALSGVEPAVFFFQNIVASQLLMRSLLVKIDWNPSSYGKNVVS